MNITQQQFGTLPSGVNISLFTLTNTEGTAISISNFGGIITAIRTKDAQGNTDDIVLGYDTLSSYINNPCYFGAITGRFTGRIKQGKVSINNQTYQLPCNAGDSQLHGGETAFHKQVWQASHKISDNEVSLTLTYRSDDGEEGFPGKVNVTAIYTLSRDNNFTVEYIGDTDKTTLMNMSQHSYFNLGGHAQLHAQQQTLNNAHKNNLSHHVLTLNADHYFPMTDEGYPTGQYESVTQSPFNFTAPLLITKAITPDFAYDHYFLLNAPSSHPQRLKTKASNSVPTATVFHEKTGRRMRIYTNQPSIVFYTGNFLDGNECGKENVTYSKHAGFCIEPVNCVNQHTTPKNKALFLPSITTPDAPFHSITHYAFDTLSLNTQ